jgi:O-antigen ligase
MVFLAYTLFLSGFYFVPNAVDLYKFYIIAVFFPGLLLLRSTLHLAWRSHIWRCLLAYLCYMLLSSLWSDSFSAAQLWRDLRYTAYILSFILLMLYFFERDPRLPGGMMHLVTLVAAMAAAVSIALFEPAAQLPALTAERLKGVGITKNFNTSAFVYGFFGVMAVYFARRHWGQMWGYIYTASFAVILLFVILTQSNTGLLALTSGCSVLFLINRKPGRRVLYTGLSLALATALYLIWSLGLLNAEVDIGFTRRLPIWDYSLQRWQEAPIFGNGYQKTLLLTAAGKESVMNYAHSLFISSLRDGGLVGLFLLLPIYVLGIREGLKAALARKEAPYLGLLFFGLVCVIADVDQIITRPRELWIMLWLPLACLIACEMGSDTERSPESAADHGESTPKNIC